MLRFTILATIKIGTCSLKSNSSFVVQLNVGEAQKPYILRGVGHASISEMQVNDVVKEYDGVFMHVCQLEKLAFLSKTLSSHSALQPQGMRVLEPTAGHVSGSLCHLLGVSLVTGALIPPASSSTPQLAVIPLGPKYVYTLVSSPGRPALTLPLCWFGAPAVEPLPASCLVVGARSLGCVWAFGSSSPGCVRGLPWPLTDLSGSGWCPLARALSFRWSAFLMLRAGVGVVLQTRVSSLLVAVARTPALES